MPTKIPPDDDQGQADDDQDQPIQLSAPVRRRRFKTGARRTPAHKLRAMPGFDPAGIEAHDVAYVPPKMSVWGNDRYGVCVTSEECYAKACFTPSIFIPEAYCIDWARERGWLNGAYLEEVVEAMISEGMKPDQYTHRDGPYKAVNYSRPDDIHAALHFGPVKIAIDSSALPGDAGERQGWYAMGGRPEQFSNIDHCVAIGGCGPAKWLYEQLKVPLPSAVKPDAAGYLLFTWGTIGYVDHAWLMSCCAEAMVRNPTTETDMPTPEPDPTPDPDPFPGPNWLQCGLAFGWALIRGTPVPKAVADLVTCLFLRGALTHEQAKKLGYQGAASSRDRGATQAATLEEHRRRHGRTAAEEGPGDQPPARRR